MVRLSCAILALFLAGQIATAKVIDKNATIAGLTVYYKVILPKDYDPEKTYPGILAFPPGGQTMDMVNVTLNQNWAGDAHQRVAALAGMCVNMHVGELDTGWLEDMQQQASQFKAKGMTVRMTVEKGQSHVIRTLTGDGAARLFEEIELTAKGCGK